MGIWDKIKGELIDIVQWLDDSNDTLLYRFERYGNEIKHGAKLVVREGQQAAFINEGRLADVFGPGTYELTTRNLPILATLKGWKYGFESPFKAECYYASTRRFRDLKWGTRHPITIRDPEFPAGIQIRAFGTYCVRINDVGKFITEIAGTDGHFTTDELTNDLRNKIVSKFQDAIGESGVSIMDMAANAEEIGDVIGQAMAVKFAEYGVELTELLIENFSLPPELDKIFQERQQMGMIGDMRRYQQFKTAGAIEDMANNAGAGGDMAGGGMGMGMGFAMAQQMGNVMAPQAQPAPGMAAPPPIPGPAVVQFFLAVNGQQAGPFDANGLRQQVATGQLTRETLVWKQGMASWAKAGEVAELSSLFGAAPPPIPG